MSPFSLRFSIPGILVATVLLSTWWSYRVYKAEIATYTKMTATHEVMALMHHHQRYIENEINHDNWSTVIGEVSDLNSDLYVLDAALVGADEKIISSTRLGDIGKNAFEVLSARWRQDVSPIQSYLEASKPTRTFSDIVEETGNLVCAFPINMGSARSTIRPIKMGALIIRYDLGRRIEEATSAAAQQALTNSGLLILLMCLLAIYLDVAVVRRIRRLISSSDAVAKGDFSMTVSTAGNDELSRLGSAFNSMLEQRSAAQEALRESEELFRTIFESAPDAVFLIAAEGENAFIILETNESAEQMHGYSCGELSGVQIRELVSPDVEKETQERLRRLASGERLHFELEHRRKDGVLFPVEVTSSRVMIDGRAHIIAFARDITGRKQAEAESNRLMMAIENTGDSIIITNTDAIIVYVNAAFEKTTGYRRSEVIGLNPNLLSSGKHDESFYRALWDTLQRGEEWTGQFKNRRKDGSIYTEKARISPVQGASGNTINYISVQRDITHEQELEEQLRQAQKMDSLGTLAGGIAHDFNNILQAILGFVGVAKEVDNGNDELLTECLNEIESGGHRASDLVAQILTFSRATEVEIRNTRLAPIIREALKFLRSSMPSTVKIDLNIDPNSGSVAADGTQIYQVVMNLCTNAMHAMEPTGGVLTVTLEAISIDGLRETLAETLESGEYVQLSVEDTGTGIEPEVISRVLDPFFTTKEVGKGTGLGLAMVQGVVKAIGGGLIIESEVDVGTTVRVILPVLKTGQETEASEEIAQRPSDVSGHVLVVDDEEAITRLTALTLKTRGFTVETYNDVETAIEAFRNNPMGYDVAILDHTMPGKTGIELAHDLYKLNPKMPVFLATGLLKPSDLDANRPPNVVRILRKPFEVDDLVAAISGSL